MIGLVALAGFVAAAMTGAGASSVAMLTGDVNGDGRTDIIQAWSNNGRLGITVFTSNGTGLVNTWSTPDAGAGSGAVAWLTGDVNGDGKTDLIQVWNNSGHTGMVVYKSNGTGLVQTWSSPNLGTGPNGTWLMGDVNGDGKTDLIQLWDNHGRLGISVYSPTSTNGYALGWSTSDIGQGSNATHWLVGDVNGDGKTDILQIWSNNGRLGIIAYASNGTSYATLWSTGDAGAGASGTFLSADVNGDGLTDLVQLWDNNGRLGITVFTSTSTAYVKASSIPDAGAGKSSVSWLTGDLNLDGKTDLVQPWDNSGSLGMITYTGNGWGLTQRWASADMGGGPAAVAWLTGDVNGDGKTDLIQLWSNGGSLAGVVFVPTGFGYRVSWSGGM